jgi:hypothetical protein
MVLVPLLSTVSAAGLTLSYEDAGWLIGDCRAYRATVRGLVDAGTFDQATVVDHPEAYAEGNGHTVPIDASAISVTIDGRLVPKHPVLFSIVLVPFYAVLREWGLLLFNVLQCFMLVHLTYAFARTWFAEIPAAIAACGLLAAWIVPFFSYNVSPDVFGAVLMLGGVVLTWSAGGSRPRLVAGGALLGLSVWMRPINFAAAAALLPVVAASIRDRAVRRELAWLLLGYGSAVGGWMALNASWFGGPLVTAYDRILVLRGGVRSVASVRDCFHRPFLASLAPTLFDERYGFTRTAPHWPLLIVAAWSMARRNGWRFVAVVVLVTVPVLCIVRYDFWSASAVGNRFMLFSAAVSSVGIAWLADLVLGASRTTVSALQAAARR